MACLDGRLLTTTAVGAPEAVLLDLTAGNERLAEILGDSHAWLAGPGLGDTERTRAVLEVLLGAGSSVPAVLDADALNAMDGEPERLRLARPEGRPTVLTPHPGEIRRLLGRSVGDDDTSRGEAARELALRSGTIVCLKGHRTIVDDGQRRYVNGSGNPGMATAGTGDVLAGVLVAYLARAQATRSSAEDIDAFALTCTAVHVHGRAGDFAADRLGPRAVIATDLIDALGQAQRELE